MHVIIDLDDYPTRLKTATGSAFLMLSVIHRCVVAWRLINILNHEEFKECPSKTPPTSLVTSTAVTVPVTFLLAPGLSLSNFRRPQPPHRSTCSFLCKSLCKLRAYVRFVYSLPTLSDRSVFHRRFFIADLNRTLTSSARC